MRRQQHALALLFATSLIAGACQDTSGPDGTVLRVLPGDSIVLNALGDSAQFSAIAERPDGTPVVKTVRWRSISPDVASVTTTGIVIARAPGTAIVEAEVAGAAAVRVVVRVRQLAASIEIDAVAPVIAAGDSVRLRATARDARGQAVVGAAVKWWSNAEFAPVDSTGLTRVRTAGDIQIIVTSGPVADTVRFQSRLRYKSVHVGARFACGLSEGNDPYCWGDPSYHQLGSGSSGDHGPLLTHTSHGPVRFTMISAGSTHACAVAEDARGYCWGNRSYTYDFRKTQHATLIDSVMRFRSISAGETHTCAVYTNGKARCWGHDSFPARGKLGIDFFYSYYPTATDLPGSVDYIQAAAGGDHSCALAVTGRAYCWGSNHFGQLGIGVADTLPHITPIEVAGGLEFTAIEAGAHHTCGVTRAGALYCWGSNEYGKLGINAAGQTCTMTDAPRACATAPAATTLTSGVTSVSAGEDHTCALATAMAYCWGSNADGRAGLGALVFSATPRKLPGAWTSIGVGARFSCGVREGVAVCWGENGVAQLGTGAMGGAFTDPIRVLFQW